MPLREARAPVGTGFLALGCFPFLGAASLAPASCPFSRRLRFFGGKGAWSDSTTTAPMVWGVVGVGGLGVWGGGGGSGGGVGVVEGA